MAGRVTAALAVAICLPLLAACVGGGAPAIHLHDDAVRTEPLGVVGIDSWSPVLTVDNTTYVGSGVVESLGIVLVAGGQEGIQSLRAGRHGDTRVFHGRVRNGVGRDRLVQYLREDARFDGTDEIERFGVRPPVVRALAGTSDEQWYELRLAVQTINAALPRGYQLRTDTARSYQRQPAAGEIVVSFTRGTVCEAAAWGCAISSTSSSGEITAGEVWIDSTRPDGRNERLGILIHEILHVLGRGHPDPYAFPDTIMVATGTENSGFVLSQLDREALLAVYGRLDPGTREQDIYLALGDWEDRSVVVGGVMDIPGGTVAFGAAEMNGHVQAWSSGPTPWEWLEDNETLLGSARWSGRLVGLTPRAKTVAGAADLSIRLATLDGRLDFTGLESWAADAAPGAAGTGSRWGDGDLGYGVEVGGNQFWATSGDDGIVDGSFFGVAHEGMGGVVKREDLTAAFGGSR